METTLEAETLPPLVIPPTASVRTRQLGRLNSTANFLRWSLITFIAARTIVAAELLTLFVLFELTDRGVPGAYEAYFGFTDMVIGWDQTLVIISVGAFIACAIAFMLFVFRGIRRLEEAGSPEVSYSPWFGAFGAMIPIMAWFVPFNAIRQISRGAAKLAGAPPRTGIWASFWWGSWVLTSILSPISFYAERAAESAGFESANAFRNLVYADVALAAAFIFSTICLLVVVRRIMRDWRTARELQAIAA